MNRKTYIELIREGFTGEIRSQAMLGAIADNFGQDSERYEQMRLLEQLEAVNGQMMKRLVVRHGIDVPDEAELRTEGVGLAANFTEWPQMMEALRGMMPKVVADYQSLAAAADPNDKEILDLFAEHEVLLLDLSQEDAGVAPGDSVVTRKIVDLVDRVAECADNGN